FLEQVRENILGSAIRELGVVNVRIAANMSVDLDCETRIRRQNGIKLLKYGHRLGNYFFLISHKVNVSQPDDIAWFLVFEYVWNIIINRITDCKRFQFLLRLVSVGDGYFPVFGLIGRN